MVRATLWAGAFFRRYTLLFRCCASSASSRSRIASTISKSLAEPEAMMLLVRWSTAKRMRHQRVLALEGLRRPPPPPKKPPAAARLRLLAEQGLQHLRHERRVAVDDMKDLDLRFGRRNMIQLADQDLDQLHAFGRTDDDQGVGPRIGRDAHVGEDARGPQLLLPLGIDGHELQRRWSGRLRRRLRVAGPVRQALAAARSVRAPRRRLAR